MYYSSKNSRLALVLLDAGASLTLREDYGQMSQVGPTGNITLDGLDANASMNLTSPEQVGNASD